MRLGQSFSRVASMIMWGGPLTGHIYGGNHEGLSPLGVRGSYVIKMHVLPMCSNICLDKTEFRKKNPTKGKIGKDFMDDDEKLPSQQPSQPAPADADTLYPTQPKLFLPGQEGVNPTTYSGNTIPFGRASAPDNVPTVNVQLSSLPKAEPLGSAILSSYPNNAQIQPLSSSRRMPFHVSKGAWWIALPIGLAIFAIVMALVAIPVSAAWLANNTAQTASKSQASQATTVASAPIPTSIPTAIPTPTITVANSISANGITLTPDHFNVQNDCQPDNNFRCTVTLALDSNADNAVSWSASIDGVDSSLHPRRGTLEPGQQQQIIISLFESCPIDASFRVSVKHHSLRQIPLQCGG